MADFEIKDVIPRKGVFDVKILNEDDEIEVFTFDNEKKENKRYKDEIRRRLEKRNREQLDKSEFEDDIGEKHKLQP